VKFWRHAGVALAVSFFSAWAGAQVPSPAQTPLERSSTEVKETAQLDIVVGQNRTLPAGLVGSYSIGAPGIVEVKLTPDAKQFVFAGIRAGSTSVLFILRDGKEITYIVDVFAREPKTVLGELEQLLVGTTGVRIRRIGARFFLEGGVNTEADAKRLKLISELYPGQVESVVVVGSVGPEQLINIRIDFYFVQFNKNSNYGVGVSWPNRIGAGAISYSRDLVTNTTSARATFDQILPSLDFAATQGWAKVLKQSTVVTTSGAKATFNSGGEQNFAVATGLTGTIQAIPFGTNVTVEPRYDMTRRDLHISLQADVADLTAPAGTATLPGRQTAHIETLIHLKLGQSLVLSGIRTQSQTHSVTGVPFLSQIPVLGLLFGGHTNSETDTEGAVFIVPSIVEAVPKKSFDMVQDAMDHFEHFSGNITERESYPHSPPSYR